MLLELFNAIFNRIDREQETKTDLWCTYVYEMGNFEAVDKITPPKMAPYGVYRADDQCHY